MPDAQITNPRGAFGQTASGNRNVDFFTAGSGGTTAGRFVKLSGIDTVVALTDGSNLGVGVALDTVVEGKRCRVVTRGFATVTSASSFAAAAKLAGASGGKAEDATVGDETASIHAVATAIAAASGADEDVLVWVY